MPKMSTLNIKLRNLQHIENYKIGRQKTSLRNFHSFGQFLPLDEHIIKGNQWGMVKKGFFKKMEEKVKKKIVSLSGI